MKKTNLNPITTYGHDFKKDEVDYKVNISCYSEPIIDTTSNGPCQTTLEIVSNNGRAKIIYLPNYLDDVEAVKIFAEIETKINDLL